MERVRIKNGDYAGLEGDLVYLPQANQYSVSLPTFENAEVKEVFAPKEFQIINVSGRSPILALKENTNLQYAQDVQMIIHKKSCASVWCKQCFTAKGGAKRIADRLQRLNWKKTRQVILTIDPKKFKDGQEAYELIREKGALHQYVHNLKRTSEVKIDDWVWILEWHRNGFPHWHLFLEVEKEGRAGMIGNKTLLKHWNQYGIVRESPIISQKHWDFMTGYFGSFGYFKADGKDKSHQLELPFWAKQVGYRIRKKGSMRVVEKNKEPLENETNPKPEEERLDHRGLSDVILSTLLRADPDVSFKAVFLYYLYLIRINQYKVRTIDKIPVPYDQMLQSCGQQVLAVIRRGEGLQVWKKYNIPYKMLVNQYDGTFIDHVGYVVQMDAVEFFLFDALYELEEPEDSNGLYGGNGQCREEAVYGNC